MTLQVKHRAHSRPSKHGPAAVTSDPFGTQKQWRLVHRGAGIRSFKVWVGMRWGGDALAKGCGWGLHPLGAGQSGRQWGQAQETA